MKRMPRGDRRACHHFPIAALLPTRKTIMAESKKILVLFDVDGTLTEPRDEASTEIKEFLTKLKTKTTVGIVGGSDLVKQQEQMGANIVNEVDYSFSENGLVAYKLGALIAKEVSTPGQQNLHFR